MVTTKRVDPLAYLAAEIDALKTQGVYRHLRVLDDEQRAQRSSTADRDQPVLEQLPRFDDASAPAREGDRSNRAIRRRHRLGANDRRHDGDAHRARAAARRVQADRSRRRLSERLHRECGHGAAILSKEDVDHSDALNHASIIDGCRLSRAAIKVFPHKDADAARDILRDLMPGQRKLLITDGVFSMDGDIAPLPVASTWPSNTARS